jgi:hypothetical protein
MAVDKIMKYNYYYNTTPENGQVRNNLVYTSLISEDQKTFVKWFHNDTEYHNGMNLVVDPDLMESKWQRELRYITLMNDFYPEHIPVIQDINHSEKKIYFQIDGYDFWQQHYDKKCSYDQVLPDWQEQMLTIIDAHKQLDLYKYSMHPSSYFIVNGKLKSINYFFAYQKNEDPVTLGEHKTHISLERTEKLEKIMKSMNLTWDSTVPFYDIQMLCFESFKNNYPEDFIERAKQIYAN